MDLILASQSPRRRALLEHFGFKFRVEVLSVEEVQSGPPLETARANAVAKAQPVSLRYPQALVLGADTIVVLDGLILGKPRDAEDARRMLRALSGRAHEVTTVVALLRNGQEERVVSETTKVQFRQLTEAEITGYVATGEPLDKAGAYGIQGLGGLLVQSIKGCYYNVVGLPVPRLVEELRPYGIEVFSSR